MLRFVKMKQLAFEKGFSIRALYLAPKCEYEVRVRTVSKELALLALRTWESCVHAWGEPHAIHVMRHVQ